jgi:hypothetical protein
MIRVLFAAAPAGAGIWHRFRVVNHVRTFANYAGCRVCFLWGVSSGVSFCRFEELLSPVKRVEFINVSEPELNEVERLSKKSENVRFRGQNLAVYRAGGSVADRMLAFDIAAAEALERLARSRAPLAGPLAAIPAPVLRKRASACIRDLGLSARIGVRVRVTECAEDGRRPRRLQGDLDDTVKSIIRVPWHVRVFVVTDSEYIQQMLASHFHDTKFLPKRFGEKDNGGRYVYRHDRDSMLTFLTEVMCLTACSKIINVGGFLNQESVQAKIIRPPWGHEVFGLKVVSTV